MSLSLTPRHCHQCGGPLAPSPDPAGPPFFCLSCGLKVYLDPKVAAAAVLEHQGGAVLLRRAQRDQAYGRWILPGGHVDRGEEVHRAALREVAEETGLRAELGRLLGVYSYPDNPVVLVVYHALSNGGPLNGGREALEIRSFAPEELPWNELGYASTGHALKDWLALKGLPAPSGS